MHLATLAEREGAGELFEVAARGGKRGKVALLALGWAPDGRAERARVCQLLERVRRDERHWVLQVVHRLVAEAPEFGEELAPGADHECRRLLKSVTEEAALEPAQRDLVEATLQHLRPPR